MAKDKDWLSCSKHTFGEKSGGGGVGRGSSDMGLGKKDGGKPQSGGPTQFGSKSGGGAGAKGSNHPLNTPKGIGLKKR